MTISLSLSLAFKHARDLWLSSSPSLEMVFSGCRGDERERERDLAILYCPPKRVFKNSPNIDACVAAQSIIALCDCLLILCLGYIMAVHLFLGMHDIRVLSAKQRYAKQERGAPALASICVFS